MKRFLLSFLFLFILSCFYGNEIYSQKPTRDQVLEKLKNDQSFFNSAQGREFWIAIPPNEADGQPVGNTDEIAIEIYVTAWEDTYCTVEYPGTGHQVTKKVEALTITTFSSQENETSFMWEIRQSEKVLNKGVHVYADKPISVYVLSHRHVTSEGYLALPMSACGKKYMHLCYYDFMENNYGGEYRGSGFIITAAENNTQCRIQLRGRGGAVGQTWGGHHIGDHLEVTLNKGQTYLVMGDGKTRGQFDLSGSTVIANKPVGFISFHKRTLIPSYDLWNGRDLLVEMMPPMNAWGKKYVTIEYKRKNHGDFFRIIASEDNTKWSCKYYDPVSQNLLGQYGGTLKKAGDFDEFLEVFVERNSHNTLRSIRGSSVWEADKPVLVMQYSYSADWDNATEFDPFMILVVPQEQFLNKTVFQTPDGRSGFNTNWFNIVAIGDTSDPAQEKLKTIEVDRKPVWTLDASFVFNNIPTTNLYWAKLPMAPGAHKIEGETGFGGYIYGFSQHDSYGWPAAMAINKLDETDTLAPQIYISGKCGEYEIETTEVRNGKEGDNPRQIDQGVAEVELLNGSFNFEDPILPPDFKPYPPVYEMTFEMKVEDIYQDGKAVFAVVDRVSNIAVDSIRYEADSLLLDPEEVVFPNVPEGESMTMDVRLISASDSIINVNEIYLKKGNAFEITVGAVPPEFELMPRDEHDLQIKYTPTGRPEDNFDSLIAITDCLRWAWPVRGSSIIPKIKVVDWDAGNVIVGKTKCISEMLAGLQISNPGTDTLLITGFRGVHDPFSVSGNLDPTLPIKIPPGGRVYLNEICFSPTADGSYSIDVTFENNGAGPDSVSNWRGTAASPGPYITGYDWNKRRVKTINDTVVFIRNEGTSPVRVTGVHLDDQMVQNFSIDKDNIQPRRPTVSNPVTLAAKDSSGIKEIVVPVTFEPQEESQNEINIYPEFHEGEGIEAESISNKLFGDGILPKIVLEGYRFEPPILINTTHPSSGKVRIYSTSETADLHIKGIKWSQSAQNPDDFRWVNQPPQDMILPRGDSLILDVLFQPLSVGERVTTVVVKSDAAPGPETDPTVETTADVVGNAFDRGMETDGHDFGDVILCDDPQATIPITNTGTTDPITIYGVELVEGDIGVFEIGTYPDMIDPTQTVDVPVWFHPVNEGTGTYEAKFAVYADIDTLYATIEGVGYDVRVDLGLKELHNMAPGMATISPPHQDFPIVVQCNNWADAEITEFTIELVYMTTWLSFNKIHAGDAIDGNWTIDAREEFASTDQEWTKLIIEGSGTTPLSRNGNLLRPEFQIMLADSGSFSPRYGLVSFGDRDRCVRNETSPGKIHINTCVQDMRSVVISSTKYALHEITPNPVTGSEFNVEFTLGIKAHTRIEIINSAGDVVDVPVEGVLAEGKYKRSIATDKLSSGVYTIHIQSGPFTDSRRLVIVK